jgi:hypothetical protein
MCSKVPTLAFHRDQVARTARAAGAWGSNDDLGTTDVQSGAFAPFNIARWKG